MLTLSNSMDLQLSDVITESYFIGTELISPTTGEIIFSNDNGIDGDSMFSDLLDFDNPIMSHLLNM